MERFRLSVPKIVKDFLNPKGAQERKIAEQDRVIAEAMTMYEEGASLAEVEEAFGLGPSNLPPDFTVPSEI